MPLFSTASPFDEAVEEATKETNTTENWALFLEICDRTRELGAKGATDCLLSIKKRLNARDPHVVILAVSLLDSCMSNCGSSFREEVASKPFIAELRSKATSSNRSVGEKTRIALKRWVDEECKNDPSLSLLPALFHELKREGWEFASSDVPNARGRSANEFSAQKEAEDLAKAIQMSLKEGKGDAGAPQGQPAAAVSSMYPSSHTARAQRTVKALYDFEAAEDNELTFHAGEYIAVQDDSDVNWWRGVSQRGEGLFPASFVTSDLNAATEASAMDEQSSNSRKVSFHDTVEVKTLEHAAPVQVTIDEEKLNQCMDLLEDSDPTGERPDPEELPSLEDACQAMGPLIDAELERTDTQHSTFAELNVKLMDALSLYHNAMSQAAQMAYGQQGPPVAGPQMYVPNQPYPAAPMQQQQPPHIPVTYGAAPPDPTVDAAKYAAAMQVHQYQQQQHIVQQPMYQNQQQVYQQPMPSSQDAVAAPVHYQPYQPVPTQQQHPVAAQQPVVYQQQPPPPPQQQ